MYCISAYLNWLLLGVGVGLSTYLTFATVGRLRVAGGYTAQHRSLYTFRWVARYVWSLAVRLDHVPPNSMDRTTSWFTVVSH